MKQSLTYDDIQLIPSYSDIKSRQDVNLHTLVSRRYGLITPIVASPMDTVCEEEMAFSMFLAGGVGCIHRFMTIERQAEQIKNLRARIYDDSPNGRLSETWESTFDNWRSEISMVPIMAAIGVMEHDTERAKKLVDAGANILVIDVAHGHHKNVIDMIKWCKENLPTHVDIIAGNIVTAEAAESLIEAGADGLRVGVGGGAVCTTRIKTGFGLPNVTAIENVSSVSTVPVMADGGIRTSGDIAKALAVGANSVMLGSLLAGTYETPGEIILDGYRKYKEYRGSASLRTKEVHNKESRNIEGESTTVSFKGRVEPILNDLLDGVKSALSYAGSNNLGEFKPDYVKVTQAGMREAKPHLL